MFDFIGLAKVVGELINKFVPDADKAQELKAAIEVKLIEASTMQQQINMKEAGHSSMFVAGWRPFIGWTCGVGLFYTYLFQPLGSWVSLTLGGIAFPVIDTATLISLLVGMLGLGGIRTYEKVKEIARENGIVSPTWQSVKEVIKKPFNKKSEVTQFRD